VTLLNQLLLGRKADEVWDISKESNAIYDIGDYLTEMNIHVDFYHISQAYNYSNFTGLLMKAWLI
jgi:hypothetical protein